MAESEKPSEFVRGADNQGNQNTCTHHALRKAICNNLMKNGVDAQKDAVLGILLNDGHKSLDAKDPCDFHGHEFNIKDQNSNEYYCVKCSVEVIKGFAFVEDREKKTKNEHLVTYYPAKGAKRLHCVFVNEFDSDEDELICINSWGSIEDEPIIKTIQVKKFYRVSCIAEKIEDANGAKAKPSTQKPSRKRSDSDKTQVMEAGAQGIQNMWNDNTIGGIKYINNYK